MNADGSGKTDLTQSPGQDHSPAWSPGGAKIAFASQKLTTHRAPILTGSTTECWPCESNSVRLGSSPRALRALAAFGLSAGVLASRASSASLLPKRPLVRFATSFAHPS